MRNWSRRRWSIALWAAAAVWCGVLFFFSGQNADVSYSESMSIVEFVRRQISGAGAPNDDAFTFVLMTLVRKSAHAVGFLIQGALLGGAALTGLDSPKRAWRLALLIGALVGVLNELFQAIVPGRLCKFTDMLLNVGGAALGVLLALLLRRLLLRRRRG